MVIPQLDQAKMQEQMNKAMVQLSETVGQDVPTLEEVRDKIEQRYAKAQGTAELHPFSRAELDGLTALAQKGVKQLVNRQKKLLKGLRLDAP